MDLSREIEHYRNTILANPPKVSAKIILYWTKRIKEANLYSLGEEGAYKYITKYGGKFSEKTLILYALQSEIEAQLDMARGFWKRAYLAKKKKDSSTMVQQPTDSQNLVFENHPGVGKKMESSSLKVFLCHSSSDKPTVRNLFHRLRNDGVDPWLDEEKLLPGQEWQQEIPKAVRQSDVVLVCLSKASINKVGYVQREIRFALDIAEEQPEGFIFIIPVRLEECSIPGRLQKWQWVDLFRENGYQRLMLSLKARANMKNL